jgi:hypothetical protein
VGSVVGVGRLGGGGMGCVGVGVGEGLGLGSGSGCGCVHVCPCVSACVCEGVYCVVCVCVPNIQHVPNPGQHINSAYCHNPGTCVVASVANAYVADVIVVVGAVGGGRLLVGGGRGCGMGGGVARWEGGVGLVGGDVVVGG